MKVLYDKDNRPNYHIEDEYDKFIYHLAILSQMNVAMCMNGKNSNFDDLNKMKQTAQDSADAAKKHLKYLLQEFGGKID